MNWASTSLGPDTSHCPHPANLHTPPMAELIIRRGLEEPDNSATFTPHRPARPHNAEDAGVSR